MSLCPRDARRVWSAVSGQDDGSRASEGAELLSMAPSQCGGNGVVAEREAIC
jgi:hypothetical protein